MCTLLIAFRSHAAAPVVVAANRDEMYARPTEPTGLLVASELARYSAPSWLEAGPRAYTGAQWVVGGRDCERGGTWLGLNSHGVFVALTNLRKRHSEQGSRGLLVLEALNARTPAEISERLAEAVDGGDFAPFNLVYGTTEEIMVAHWPGEHLELKALSPGVHVVPSGARLDDITLPKVSQGSDLFAAALARHSDDTELIAALRHVLADHTLPSLSALPPMGSPWGPEVARQLQALCVHTPIYGTRSSSLLLLREHGSRFFAIEGAPCSDAELREVELPR